MWLDYVSFAFSTGLTNNLFICSFSFSTLNVPIILKLMGLWLSQYSFLIILFKSLTHSSVHCLHAFDPPDCFSEMPGSPYLQGCLSTHYSSFKAQEKFQLIQEFSIRTPLLSSRSDNHGYWVPWGWIIYIEISVLFALRLCRIDIWLLWFFANISLKEFGFQNIQKFIISESLPPEEIVAFTQTACHRRLRRGGMHGA